jgi:diamine N-acetyltransferase
MNSEPAFRMAVESDAELLLEFMQAYYAFDGHAFDRGKARVALLPLLRDANFGRAWLILDYDAPVGYAVLCFGYSLEWLGRDAFVDEFYLREEYRGRGWDEKP